MDSIIKFVDDLTLLKPIGKGTYGEVYLSQLQGKQGYFAAKKINKIQADQPGNAKYLRDGLLILKKLRHHRNIIKLVDCKETNNNFYIVMELCNGGSLKDCLKKYQEKTGKPFTEEIVQYLMRQIIDVMKYAHSLGIIHRDLKLDNILVKFNNESDKNNLEMMKATIKIIDFDCSTYMNESNLVYTGIGTPISMAPTVLNNYYKMGINNIGYNEKADVWSLGTLCYEMLIGKSAFDAQTVQELVNKVLNGSYKVPTSLSKEAISFLNAMLQIKSENRFSCEELSRHYFLIKNIEDFQPIDLTAVSNNIHGNKITINANLNNTIWAVFEDSITLINIPGNYIIQEPINQINLQSPISHEINIKKAEKVPLDNVKKDHKKMKSAVNPNYYINNDGFNPIKNINDDIYGGTMANNQNIPESSSDNIQVDCGDVDDLDCKNSTNDDYQFLSKIPFMIANESNVIDNESIMTGITSNLPVEDINNLSITPPDEKPKEISYICASGIYCPLDNKKNFVGYTSGIGGYDF